MPCGAKLPVISLFAGAFFKESAWVGVTMYFVGIALILLCALLINLLTGYKIRRSFFIMELPEYKAPSVKRAFLSMCQRGWAYIVKAGTIILVCNFVIHVMQSFNWRLELVDEASESILSGVATPFAYVIAPVVGVVAWQLAAAAITGFIAKENVVGTLAVCFVGLENFINTEELSLMEGAGAEVAAVFAITKAAALAYLMFNLFTPPCFAALGAMRSELNDRKWFWGGVGLQFATGYTVAFLVYQAGTLLTEGTVGKGFLPGLMAVTVMALVIVAMIRRTDRLIVAEKAAGKSQVQIVKE
jgi:ferrous iron transport protein B